MNDADRRTMAPWSPRESEHGRLGLRYLVVVTALFLLGGVLGLFLRLDLLGAGRTVDAAREQPVLLTLHGVVMVLLFLLPALPAVLGNLVVQSLCGAERALLPRVGHWGLGLHVGGALIVLATLVMGGADVGWTFTVPYSLRSATTVTPLALGGVLLAAAGWLNALGLLGTIVRRRTVPWEELPLTAWALLLTSLTLLVALPVLVGALLLLIIGMFGDLTLIDPALGGDPDVWRRMFWLGAHPAVMVMVLPALGIVSDIVADHADGRPDRVWLVRSFAAVAVLSVLGSGSHLLGAGRSAEVDVVTSGLTLLSIVPVVAVLLELVRMLLQGVRHRSTALALVPWLILQLTVAVLATLLLGSLATGPQLRGSLFESAQLHYLALGVAFTALLAGVLHWWTALTPRPAPGRGIVLGTFLLGLGINLTFGPHLLAGVHGTPARLLDLLSLHPVAERVATMGILVLTVALAVVATALISALRRQGDAAPS